MTDRPYWLTTPCPKWCTARHQTSDPVNQREHRSDALGALVQTAVGTRNSGEPVHGWVRLVQGYREVAPLLHLHQGAKPVLVFTLGEAQQLAATMLDAVRIGESEYGAQANR